MIEHAPGRAYHGLTCFTARARQSSLVIDPGPHTFLNAEGKALCSECVFVRLSIPGSCLVVLHLSAEQGGLRGELELRPFRSQGFLIRRKCWRFRRVRLTIETIPGVLPGRKILE